MLNKSDLEFINNNTNNMSFLPKEEKEPIVKSSSADNYMKFDKEKENRFRIMGGAIIGWELWVEGKPIRKKDELFTEKELSSADKDPFSPDGFLKTPRYFWAFPVYNYATESIQILEITQSTIREGIKGYMTDEDFGEDVTGYDFVVKMNDDGKGYTVRAKPPKDMDKGITKLYEDMGIDLEQLFSSKDPFSKEVKPEELFK